MTIEATELHLFAMNDRGIYERNWKPAVANLCRKVAKGIYDHNKAVDLFVYTAEFAAKEYCKQFGSKDDRWSQMFSVAVRREAAAMLRDTFENEYEANQWAGINPIRPEHRPTIVTGAAA